MPTACAYWFYARLLPTANAQEHKRTTRPQKRANMNCTRNGPYGTSRPMTTQRAEGTAPLTQT
eukprot:5404343-Lingulodinium_polyedra.AAC.1